MFCRETISGITSYLQVHVQVAKYEALKKRERKALHAAYKRYVVHCHVGAGLRQFSHLQMLSFLTSAIHPPPPEGHGCLMSPPSLESQLCRLIPLSYPVFLPSLLVLHHQPSQLESMLMILNCALPENIHTLLKSASDCYLDIRNWMTQNKLQPNSEKRETMLIGTGPKLSSISVNTLQLDHTTVPLSDSVKSLGILLHCPWRTSSVKLPNPATTSSIKLVLSGNIFPLRLQ